MRICVILEGCYPYVTGGVSSWMHQYIQAMPQHEFVVWAINADPSQNGKFRYTLPDNVVEVKEISLTAAPVGRKSGRTLHWDLSGRFFGQRVLCGYSGGYLQGKIPLYCLFGFFPHSPFHAAAPPARAVL